MVSNLVTGGPVERIFHLACAASPAKYQKDPLQTLRTNYVGTTNVLELPKKHGASVRQAISTVL